MRRFARSLFTLCSAASLVVCMALVVAWFASYANVTFASSRGVLHLVRVPPRADVPNPLSVTVGRRVDDGSMRLRVNQRLGPSLEYGVDPTELTPTWTAPGVRFWDVQAFSTFSPQPRGGLTLHLVRVQVLAVAYGWLVAAAALYPAVRLGGLAVRVARQRRWRRRNQCPSCGYDLRASPGRCPECGATR